MRNAIVMALFAVSSASAAAAWTKASESPVGTGYVDRATIIRSGHNITMWELTDYKVVPDPKQSIQVSEAAIRIRLQG
jgi:hypothetical protein